VGGTPARLPESRYLACVVEVTQGNWTETWEGLERPFHSGWSTLVGFGVGFKFGGIAKTQGINSTLARYAGELVLGKSHPDYVTQYLESGTFFRPTYAVRVGGQTMTGLSGLVSGATFNILKGLSINAAFDAGVGIGSLLQAGRACIM
jgi:hypothetical protein